MTEHNPAERDAPSEREKWEAEQSFRARELALREREQESREAELELKRKEQASSGWRSPLVVAIIAATVAAVGNAAVTVVNGVHQRRLEEEKSEQARILEMIKTGDPDSAANNLEFLLQAGLISNQGLQTKLKDFLTKRTPGSGPTLPTQSVFASGGIVGPDDAVEVDKLSPGNVQTPAVDALKEASKAVGQIKAFQEGNDSPFQCTAFLVADDLLLTAGFCVDGITAATLSMYEGGKEASYKVNLPPLEVSSDDDEVNYALLRVDGKPGAKHGALRLSPAPPAENRPLSLLMFRGSSQKLAVTGAADCRVLKVGAETFHHRCDTGGGSSGAPLLTSDGSQVLGLHFRRDEQGGEAVRADALLKASKLLQSVK